MIEETKEEWRELGFFYDSDDEKKEWILTGSKIGLFGFCECLRSYSKNERNNQVSEHDHYGPYMYLKIMTWSEAGINKGSIHGSLKDLLRLSGLIDSQLESATPGDSIAISSEYTSECDYKLILNIMPDAFDPSSPDRMEWAYKIDEK